MASESNPPFCSRTPGMPEIEIPLECNSTRGCACPPTKLPRLGDAVFVYFFCKNPQHYPKCWKGKAYECHLCNPRETKNNLYYCAECAAEGREICHYAGKHINNHVNNMHGRRKVDRHFAACHPEVFQIIEEYKRNISAVPKRKRPSQADQSQKRLRTQTNTLIECDDGNNASMPRYEADLPSAVPPNAYPGL